MSGCVNTVYSHLGGGWRLRFGPTFPKKSQSKSCSMESCILMTTYEEGRMFGSLTLPTRSPESTSRPCQSYQITHFIPIWGWSISAGPARLHYPQTSCEMAIMCVQACGGEWASMSGISLYQPNNGASQYMGSYHVQVSTYKYVRIWLLNHSGIKAWQQLLQRRVWNPVNDLDASQNMCVVYKHRHRWLTNKNT